MISKELFETNVPGLRHGPTDDAWQHLGPLMKAYNVVGRPPGNNRRFLHAVLWICKTGSPWRDLPKAFGAWRGLHARFLRWARRGWWQHLWSQGVNVSDVGLVSMDSTSIKAAPCAAGARKRSLCSSERQRTEALGRSVGGLSTKFHAVVSSRGHLLSGFLTPGQTADASMGERLVNSIQVLSPHAICGDKAYDSHSIRERIRLCGAETVIPSRSNRLLVIPHDRLKYIERNKVERYFRRLKDHRKIALRSDKLAVAFLAWIWIASTLDQLQQQPS